MLALIACILFVLAVFGVKIAGLNMIALGLAFLAAHLVVPVVGSWRRGS